MISMRRIDKIRSLYFDDGYNKTEIARKVNCSVNTVSKYVNCDNYSPKARTPNNSDTKIMPYLDDMKQFLMQERNGHYKQRITGKRMFELLTELHSDYPCSYPLTLKYFKKLRLEFYSRARQFIPIKHQPGETQVDFGEFYYIQGDERLKGYLVTVAFPYSGALYCQAFRGKSSECLLQGLKNIFKHIGGVPYEVTCDNDVAIVHIGSSVNRERNFCDLFLRFKNHYGFRTRLCNSKSPNEKANVEVGIKTIRMKLLSPMPIVVDLDSFNKQLLLNCDKLLESKRKGLYNTLKSTLFVSDKNCLSPLPKIDFDVASFKKRRTNDMGCVTIGGIYSYYLSPKYKSTIVQMKSTHDKVYFYDNLLTPICELYRLYDANGSVCYNWSEYLKLLSIKTGALAHCAIMDEFPEILREFLLDSDIKVRRLYMKIMHEVYVKSDFTTAVETASKLAENCVVDYKAMLEAIANLQQ